jgi:hypothetical protein
MIKIHALDDYKYLRDPHNPMDGFNKRNLTYICLEMTDFLKDIKAFIFLNTYHSFHYEEIAIELKKLVNSSGKLPKTHIVYREEPLKGGQRGMTEKLYLFQKDLHTAYWNILIWKKNAIEKQRKTKRMNG